MFNKKKNSEQDSSFIEKQIKKIITKAGELGLDTTKLLAAIGFETGKFSLKMLSKLIALIIRELLKTPEKLKEFKDFVRSMKIDVDDINEEKTEKDNQF